MYLKFLEHALHILTAANPGYEFRTGETINKLVPMDDLKLYTKSKRVLDSLLQKVRIFSEDIGMQFGRLYLSRSEGSRDSNLGLRDYVRNSKKRLLIAARTTEKDEDKKRGKK